MIYGSIPCSNTRLIRWQKITVAYIFIHYIVNCSLKYFTVNLKAGNKPVVCYNLLINFSWIATIFAFFHSFGNILSFKQFLKMVANILFIKYLRSFKIRILIWTCSWALLGSNFLIILTWLTEISFDVKTDLVGVINFAGNWLLLIKGVHGPAKKWIKELTLWLY